MTPLTEFLQSSLFVGVMAMVVGVTVMLAVYVGLMAAAAGRDPLRRRLTELTGKPEDTAVRTPSWLRFLHPLTPYLLPHHTGARETLKLKLVRAGFPSEAAALNLYVVKVLLVVLVPVVIVSLLLLRTDLRAVYVVFFGFLAAVAGMWLPDLFLNQRIAQRQLEMTHALPDALDLLVSCTEAGLGLNGALQRVARQMHLSSPLLARELEQVNAEIHSGIDRIAALKNFSVRTGLEEMHGLVSLLSQSLRFGSPIAQILRIYSEEFRDKRAQAAEEQAALVGTKLIFPLVFCIFPSFFIVSVGPAVIGVIRALAGVHFGK